MSDPTTTDPAPPAAPPADPPADELADEARGRIVTFYSYKGGVGRSMALANIAVILARDFGLRVVTIDWDLEAPGLHRYFGIPDAEVGRGVIDFFTNYKQLLSRPPAEVEISPHDLDIRSYANPVEEYDSGGSILFVSAGDQHDAKRYVDRVSNFDWDDFYRSWNGAQLIEAVRAQLGELGDVVLIDSRTGITDTGGICTLHLPDVVVLVFVFNSQNLDGIARIAGEISGKNEVFEITKRHPEALFLPSRKDVSEIAQLREWEHRAVELFEPYLLASPRTVERFGDDALECIRVTSVPYVPYFAFGEELAARTDKGYEMIAALEVLAGMLSDRPPLIVPRKSTSSQPHAAPMRESSQVAVAKGMSRPPREPSTPGRRIAPAAAAAPGQVQSVTLSASLANETPADADHDDERVDAAPVPELPTKAEAPAIADQSWAALAFLGVVVLVGVMFIWISPIQLWGSRGEGSDESGASDGDPTAQQNDEDGQDTRGAESEDEGFDPAKLRADVRFEFLTVHPRGRPPARAFDGSLRCKLAVGRKPQREGWSPSWQLDEVELELQTITSEAQNVADGPSVQSVTYMDFALAPEAAAPPLLAELAGRAVQARLVGPSTNPGWLTEAWQLAEAQGLSRTQVREKFRSFYAVDDDTELSIDVTPVVATMRLEYDGRAVASLAGWVARDPGTYDFIVNFVAVELGGLDELGDNPPPELAPSAERLAPYLAPRDARAEWLTGIQGVGTYTKKGSKRYYQLGVAIPSTALEEIEGVRYEFPDGKELTAKSPGPRNEWPVTDSRSGCEGTVSISIMRTNGVTLPLTFDWCQDAVEVEKSGQNTSVEVESDRSRCNKNLVAKNPHLAAQVCAQEYGDASSDAERLRLLANLIAATQDYGGDRQHCLWLREAAEMGNQEAASLVVQTGGRCDPALMEPQQRNNESVRRKKQP